MRTSKIKSLLTRCQIEVDDDDDEWGSSGGGKKKGPGYVVLAREERRERGGKIIVLLPRKPESGLTCVGTPLWFPLVALLFWVTTPRSREKRAGRVFRRSDL